MAKTGIRFSHTLVLDPALKPDHMLKSSSEKCKSKAY